VCYQNHFLQAGMQPYGRKTYNTIFRQSADVMSGILYRQVARLREYIKTHRLSAFRGVLSVSIDGCYLVRGHHSDYMTTLVICKNIHCPIAIAHTSRVAKHDQDWFMYKHLGTATGAEAFATDIVVTELVNCGIIPDKVVLDGDDDNHNVVQLSWPDAETVYCFNHWCKAGKKLLEAGFSSKQAVDGYLCMCHGRNHIRAGPTPCCCATAMHAHHAYSMMFGAASIAGDDHEKFAAVVSQFPAHLAGSHDSCSFHAKMRCGGSCDPPCPTRECDCGACPDDGPRECFGNTRPIDPLPTCKSPKPWKSSLHSICCDKDNHLVKQWAEKSVKHQKFLIIKGFGKMDTCENEHYNKGIADARAKGQVCSPAPYRCLTEKGILESMQHHYVRVMQKIHNVASDVIQDDWLYLVEFYREMGCPLPARAIRHMKDVVLERMKNSDALKTDISKVKRSKGKHKRKLANESRKAHDLGMTYRSNQQFNKDTPQPCVRINASSGILVVFDLETAGWGRYHDTVMQLSARVLRYETTDAGVVFTELHHDFNNFSRVLKINQSLPAALGHNQALEDKVRAVAQSETAVMHEFARFLGDGVTPSRRADEDCWLVAHNGTSCDAQVIEMAFQRSSIDSVKLFKDVGIKGLIDTITVSRTLPWYSYTTPTVDPPPTEAARASVSSPVRTTARAEFSSPVITSPSGVADALTPRNVNTDDSCTDAEPAPTVIKFSGFKQVAERRAKQRSEYLAKRGGAVTVEDGGEEEHVIRESHAMGFVYNRLTGKPAIGAHDSSVDVSMLAEFVQHPFVWSRIGGRVWGVPWVDLKQRTDVVHGKHLQKTRGWRLENCPACIHGAMKPNATNKGVNRSVYTDGWKVVFTCVIQPKDAGGSYPEGAWWCPDVEMPTAEGFVEATARHRQPRSAAAQDKGEPGACKCKTKCARKPCPCKAAKVVCTTSCAHCLPGSQQCPPRPMCANHGGSATAPSSMAKVQPQGGDGAPVATQARKRGSPSGYKRKPVSSDDDDSPDSDEYSEYSDSSA
jgi:DNA polymerase III epsilon subunit-like protein